MKFTGAVPVLLMMIYTGFKISSHYKERKKLLENTVLLLNLIELDFQYSFLSVYEIIKKYSSENGLNKVCFIEDCMSKINEGYDFPVAWCKAVQECKKYNDDEKAKLISLGEILGTSSVETQLNIIGYYKTIFESKYENCKKDYIKYSEASILICTFVGIGLFIILI